MTSPLPTSVDTPFRYPLAPFLPNTDFLEPSPAFRQHVKRTLWGIIGFAVLYVCLIGFGFALGYVCILSTLWLIGYSVNKFTIIIGLGLLALGVMFLLFLVKFAFAVYKNQNAQRVEITADDHPALFAFIDRLTDEVKAPKPFKIYLSPNVNASVFYNSSFWSLFLPVRKNLEIGLGLVNSLNLSEFKAVMAHEFGHFSQRSMKIGSYVYVVNRVIYNLVYERDRWDALLDRWVASGGLWSIFAGITHVLVKLVRMILSKAYQWLNLRYMELSREMEYQADLVAASAAGGQAIVTALRRIDVGDAAYHQLLSYLNGLIGDSKVAENIYPLHTEMMHRLAQENNLEIAHGLPVLDDRQAQKMASSNRVNYQDQWSSHPSQQERESNVRSVVAACPVEETSPWSLFAQPERWQQELTSRLYEGVELTDGATRQFINPGEYNAYVDEQIQRDQLPECYNGFYDRRLLHTFDPVALGESLDQLLDAATIFSDENRQLRKQLFSNYEDRTTLEQIKANQIQTRSFDLDGKKYNRKEVDEALQLVNTDISILQDRFLKAEEDAFRWHYRKAVLRGQESELLQRTQLYFQLDTERENYQKLFGSYSELMQATHDVLKDGNKPKKTLNARIDAINEEIQQAYQRSVAIQIPATVNDIDYPEGYAAHVWVGEPQAIQSSSFNWEQMVALYQQLESIPARVATIQITGLNDLIRWQASL